MLHKNKCIFKDFTYTFTYARCRIEPMYQVYKERNSKFNVLVLILYKYFIERDYGISK